MLKIIIKFGIYLSLVCFVLCFVWVVILNFDEGRHRTSPANACINNLRQIDAAKNQWAFEHDAKSNDVVTVNDIRPYIEREKNNPFIKLDAAGNFPKCPAGGTYSIGKSACEPPTCSLGTNVIPAHVLH